MRETKMFGRKATWMVRVVCTGLIFALGSCGTNDPPAFFEWPVETDEYTIEALPRIAIASYVRGKDVYLADPGGEIFLADDGDLGKPWVSLGQPFEASPQLLFATRSGVILASSSTGLTWRRAGGEWSQVLDVPCWRMDEDDEGNLYMGNYTKDRPAHVATLYKSSDDGATWSKVFSDPNNDHIHTVRWDDRRKRLYISIGDSGVRGQAYSDDRGATFRWIVRGPKEGHTDAALTNDYLFWASDDASGRVFRQDRAGGAVETVMSGTQYMWFAVARGEQIYVGTVPSAESSGERACLLASSDQGTTWTKLLESAPSTAPYSPSMVGESREVSDNGWVYFLKLETPPTQSASYRVRHRSAGDSAQRGVR